MDVDMNSDREPEAESEQRLRRYRPIGPSPTLRARILAASEPHTPRRIWPWAVAAAAALVAIVVLHAASSGLEVRVDVRPRQDDGDVIVESIGSPRGDDADADVTRRLAALIVVMKEQQR
jgi:hypothetical protein